MYPNDPIAEVLKKLLARRSVFVSYHHRRDQSYYDLFCGLFSDTFGIVRDHSLDRVIGSDSSEYIMRCIRGEYIKGTSCTLVLCGAETCERKYVDWEIKASLDKENGLIGVNLPDSLRDPLGRVFVPHRLQDNVNSGYALWVQWKELIHNPIVLKDYVSMAVERSKHLIVNNRPLKRMNG